MAKRVQIGKWGNTGKVYITPGAADATGGGLVVLSYLMRHVEGDWGVVDAEDWQINNDAVKNGNRILSAYPIDPEKLCRGYGQNCLWIITEADRSSTTILLPDEY